MERHISELTKAIQALTKAISRPVVAMQPPVAPDPKFLVDLYRGDYEPETNRRCEVDQALIQDVEETRAALERHLTARARESLSIYDDAVVRYNSAVMERSYEAGFKTAVQMMAAGLARAD